MTTYAAHFRSDAESATHDFVAATPEQALKKARRFYKAHAHRRLFERYDHSAPVNEIAIWNDQATTSRSGTTMTCACDWQQVTCWRLPNWWLRAGNGATSPRRSVHWMLPSRRRSEVPHEDYGVYAVWVTAESRRAACDLAERMWNENRSAVARQDGVLVHIEILDRIALRRRIWLWTPAVCSSRVPSVRRRTYIGGNRAPLKRAPIRDRATQPSPVSY
jgi:hypothetical protein